MLDTSRERILQQVPDNALVLDIGGWGRPFPRADWVVDMNDYATRGLYGREPGGEERFGPDTWVQRDVCDAEPLPFADDQFDFVVCSQTLEDLRDPVRACAEIVRVGKAGYIETPSRLEEQSYGFQGPWVGWGHHHWLVEVGDGRIEFVFKHHVMHGRDSDHFPGRLPRHPHGAGARRDAVVGGLVRVRRAVHGGRGRARQLPRGVRRRPSSSGETSNGERGGSSSEPRRSHRSQPGLVPHDRAGARGHHAGPHRPARDGRQGLAGRPGR